MAGRRNPPTSFLIGLGIILVGVALLGTWYETGLFLKDADAALPLLLVWPVGVALPFMGAGLIHDWDRGLAPA